MATMSEGYRNAIADYGASLIKFIGLVDGDGVELPINTESPYERRAVYWSPAVDGIIRPYANAELTEDLIFEIPVDTDVCGWRGFSAAEGGINYGGDDVSPNHYVNPGEYRLIAAQSGIEHKNPD